MAKGSHRTVPYRRDREGKTDYHYRRRLLKSGKPRLVARVSLRHVRAQVASPAAEGDEMLATAFSKELSDFGWEAYTGNTSAAYLVGLLCGYRAKEAGVEECVLDIDKFVASPQSKVFAVLKGILDAGLYVPHDEGILPSEERCMGEHVAEYAEMLDSEGERYKSQFSSYLENGVKPEELPEHFKEVKEAIETQHGE